MVKNKKGQGLVEYLIIVALMAVATMGIMRILSQTTNMKFAKITSTLQGGKSKVKFNIERVDEKHFRKKDMSNFFKGAKSNKND